VRDRWEDDMRERDEAPRGGEEVGVGGRWKWRVLLLLISL